jgi:hypothetical protein
MNTTLDFKRSLRRTDIIFVFNYFLPIRFYGLLS